MASEPKSLPSSSQPTARRKRKVSMERVMVLFTLIFVLGILLLSLVPEEHPARGAVMGVYVMLVFWAVFRFGI